MNSQSGWGLTAKDLKEEKKELQGDREEEGEVWEGEKEGGEEERRSKEWERREERKEREEREKEEDMPQNNKPEKQPRSADIRIDENEADIIYLSQQSMSQQSTSQ
ncbi:hypothetical protein L873DRAFT_1842444 [Choiromyces venosus 120613-1]|uniref:Uncharacterized protein n=1 Tax=Choiromyces venosus 120613-1 TaxID=1336337 RepID=A0A3N4JWS2_9PEZI|nr:hypothetical protein L873DRAFT_1842444 [Choiromyces venosus 120613-1]